MAEVRHTLFCLLGASGSGKSSLVRAGILPRLRRKNEWLLLPPFMPRTNPLNEFAEVLTRAFKKNRCFTPNEHDSTDFNACK